MNIILNLWKDNNYLKTKLLLETECLVLKVYSCTNV